LNLGDLIDFCGNLLDYDPTNDTYRAQLVSLLNDAQTRCLTDRPWDFAQRDRKLQVWTDLNLAVTVTNGSATVGGGPFAVSSSAVLPGSVLDRAVIEITDSTGATYVHNIAWVLSSTQLYLDRPFVGASGSYSALVKRREVYLPSDCMQVQNVGDPTQGIPAKILFLSKFEREDANLYPDLLGTIEAYLPSEGKRIPAPQTPRGITTVAAVSQGARTINVYMVNVQGPAATNFKVYRSDVSDGWESALSKVATYSLSDTETLRFQPEVVDDTTGLYRRYYFTCPEAGILAPVRVRSAGGQGVAAAGVDTINPQAGVILAPTLALSTLQAQTFQALSVRYVWDQAAAYQSIQLYPHPSADQPLDVRMLIAPSRMLEDQDAPLVPAAYAQAVAYTALETLTLKVDNGALSAVYQRKKDLIIRGMEQAYLKAVPRRIVKGTPTSGYRYVTNPFGPLRLLP
jgi:hypothetical protein